MVDFIKEHRKLKVLYKLCFNQHEKFLNRPRKVPLKTDYEKKLRSKEYKKILFLIYCRSKKISKHLPNDIVSGFFDIKNGMN
jgi:hypothetical protein